jgi:hypothetical protein
MQLATDKMKMNFALNILRKAIGLLTLAVSLVATERSLGADAAYTEYQVKALFLYNFSKYVDWPASTFSQTDTPITIGVLGENKFGHDLEKAVAGKTVGGRKIVVQMVGMEADWSKCNILFISSSENRHLVEILDKVKTLPVLTVGESSQFVQDGGIINFMKKADTVRLEVDLNAAQLAKLQISSKLLKVADTIHGKP